MIVRQLTDRREINKLKPLDFDHLRRNPFVHVLPLEIGEFSGEAWGSRATAPNGRASKEGIDSRHI